MWQQPVSLISYLLVAVVVVLLSIYLSTFVDLLDKKTKISGAFLGGILLAATTSLPELFTSLTATLLVNNNNLVFGNILGSNLFNMTLFTVIYLFFFKKLVDAKVGKSHILTMIFTGIMYICTYVASFVFDFNHILWGWFNPMSILIMVTYVISVIKTPKEGENENDDDKPSRFDKCTVKQIGILFAVFAVALIGASIGLTYLTDWVVSSFNMSSTFGGALFLGVATSLPELTATITLCKKKNFNAAYGNILGSCCFNFIILTFADILSFNCPSPLYHLDQSAFLLLILGAVSFISLAVTVTMAALGKMKNKPTQRILFYFVGSVLLASYLAFVILSNIDLHLDFAPLVG